MRKLFPPYLEKCFWFDSELTHSGERTKRSSFWTLNQLCKFSQGFHATRERANPCKLTLRSLQQSWPLGDTAGNAQHRTTETFLNVGPPHWNRPFLVLLAERSLEVAPNRFLPHLLLGHSQVLWTEEAICKTAFELWTLPPVALLHIAWLTKPIPDAKEEQKLLDGLCQASGDQRNGSPQSPQRLGPSRQQNSTSSPA